MTLETAGWYHNRRHAPIPLMRMERSKLTNDRLGGDEKGLRVDCPLNWRLVLSSRDEASAQLHTVFGAMGVRTVEVDNAIST